MLVTSGRIYLNNHTNEFWLKLNRYSSFKLWMIYAVLVTRPSFMYQIRVAEVATNTLLMFFKDHYLQSELVTSEIWNEKRRESFDTTVAVLKLLMQTDLTAIFCLFGSVEGVSAMLKETSSYSSLLFYQKRKHRIVDNHFYYLLCGTALFNYLCTSLTKNHQSTFMLFSLYFHLSSNSS